MIFPYKFGINRPIYGARVFLYEVSCVKSATTKRCRSNDQKKKREVVAIHLIPFISEQMPSVHRKRHA